MRKKISIVIISEDIAALNVSCVSLNYQSSRQFESIIVTSAKDSLI